jgi:hypothetical protein
MKVAPMTRRLRRLRHAELPAGAIELARHPARIIFNGVQSNQRA